MVSFSMDDPADRALLVELEQLCHMPDDEALGPAKATKATPPERPLLVVTVGSLAAVGKKEGGAGADAAVDQGKRRAAHELTDRVLHGALAALGGRRFSDRLVTHVLLDGRGGGSNSANPLVSSSAPPEETSSDRRQFEQRLAHGRLGDVSEDAANASGDNKKRPRRRLDDASTDDDGDTTYTLEDIRTYQICMWTGIALVLVLLSAICCMINMDIQPDSLLYAKFQADVSSKLE